MGKKNPYLQDYQYAGESNPRDIGIYASLVTSPAYYALGKSSKDLYIQLAVKKKPNDTYVFFYREELKKIKIDSKTYIRALDDLIDHGFVKVIGYMYTNAYKPTVCISLNCTGWRFWTSSTALEDFKSKYVPHEYTRTGNNNYTIKPNIKNKK